VGLQLWELINRIFDKLPCCAICDDAIFCVHGGIPCSAATIEQIRAVKQKLHDPHNSNIMWEILWSDAAAQQQFVDVCQMQGLRPEQQDGFVFSTKRRTVFMFNEQAVDRFLRANFLTHIIRAHEVARPGYVFNFGTKFLTIFSCS